MGNRHQPENSEQDQRRERRSRLRCSPERHPRSRTSVPSSLPDPSLERTRLRFIKRGLQAPVPPKPVPLRSAKINPTKLPPLSSSRPQLRQSRLGWVSRLQLPRLGLKNPNTSRRRPTVEKPTAQRLNPPRDSLRRRREPIGSHTASKGLGARRERQSSKVKSPPTQKTRRTRRQQKRPFGLLIYLIRLLILGIGIGAIVGTLLSAFDPASQLSVNAKDRATGQAQESPSTTNNSTALPLRQEIPGLKTQLQSLATQSPNLQPGVFVVDLDTGAYLDWEGHSIFPAASTIKIPILVAFFQDVDQGKIRLDEPLTLEPDVIATGSGDLQYKKPGSQYTALEVATKMIAISDNTATNMLIKKLGGAQTLNERFRSWGLTSTAINNPLPDLEGTNTTSPRDLASLMSTVNQGELLSLRSRDRLLDIMQRTVNNSLLPKGLNPGATIAHKTGDIGSMIADAGLVDMLSGKRYIIVAMVKRPHNDASASELIRKISRSVYDYFNQPRATPTTTSIPPNSTATR
ncbi:serine hydrolase [Coleofasciculus sp. LEGE 07092]|nr:serine hydrolase [Coleofasciculus sp. LEGE 07081]MBE9150608.1 serine hydrolase [Coleofasciculus sp. LEGE 07092]